MTRGGLLSAARRAAMFGDGSDGRLVVHGAFCAARPLQLTRLVVLGAFEVHGPHMILVSREIDLTHSTGHAAGGCGAD